MRGDQQCKKTADKGGQMTSSTRDRIAVLKEWIEEISREPEPDTIIAGIIAGRRNAKLAEYARKASVTALKRTLNRMYATPIRRYYGY